MFTIRLFSDLHLVFKLETIFLRKKAISTVISTMHNISFFHKENKQNLENTSTRP